MTRKVRFVEPAKVYRMIRDELDAAYFEVMSKGDLIDRGQLRSFEENLAAFVGTKYAVGLNSGYDALHMSLRAAGIGPGDEVIVPAHTFVATASAVVNVGARPVLVDVGKDFNIDCDRIEEAVTERTRGIIPVHLSGWMADMPRVMEIAERHRLAVVEDACQSLGSSMLGKRAGSWGLAGCWSFYPFKILGGYGDGGAITTDDPRWPCLRAGCATTGRTGKPGNTTATGSLVCWTISRRPFSTSSCATCRLDRPPEVWSPARYREALSDLPDLLLPHYDDSRRDHVYQNYTVRSKQGSEFSEFLKANGIEVLTQFRKPYYRHEALKLEDRGFPETEALSREVCSLPMNVEIEDDEIAYVISVVRRFYGK
jgi:dTDP-4-amino-4,6-dideoxygalactose transaminase